MLKEFARRIGILKEPNQLRAIPSGFDEIPLKDSYNEYRIPNSKNIVTVSVRGGKDYGGMWMKDIHFRRTDQYSTGKHEVLRAQQVLETNGTVEYNIYLEALQTNDQACEFLYATYSSLNNGVLEEPHSWAGVIPNSRFEHLQSTEFRKLLYDELSQVMYFDYELPKEIDIEKTVELFVRQIQERNFSKPILVAKTQSLPYAS